MKKLTSVLVLAVFAALSFSAGSAVGANLNLPGVNASKLLADLEGKWEFTMTPTERQPISGVLTVKRGNGPAGYEGSILINELQQETPTKITKAEVNGDKFVYAGEVKLEDGTYIFEMTGTIKDGKLNGQTKVQEPDGLVVYKLQATRK
ncbi:hypothetical protein AAE02nite_11190 [Adhaeribacter aerolatus]|uniref:Lipocalin-like domain-containing protein n=1 Tax=Adhaeribacter aerolatus TaxID=670289 RepID=A0A512AUS1_9BACT|nr:hypothetical protein [Adhaeribacter aerolatus]GEO03455.1 hypothetical protein AAE02nite_11190 [Adhaeribacter aerolatus]